MKIVKVTPQNALEVGFFCIKNVKSPGFKQKWNWFKERYREGLVLKLVMDENDNPAGFIEYVPAEYAWRPIIAPNYYFIHCMMIYPNKNKGKGYGKLMLQDCKDQARNHSKDGVAVMTSKGPWMADNRIFLQNGFEVVDEKDRFQLLSWSFRNEIRPKFYAWEKEADRYQGWHLLYADQCPWHDKSAQTLAEVALDYDIDLEVKRLTSPQSAQHVPCGYGTFALIHDGKVVSDHYISATRFKNILKQEHAN